MQIAQHAKGGEKQFLDRRGGYKKSTARRSLLGTNIGGVGCFWFLVVCSLLYPRAEAVKLRMQPAVVLWKMPHRYLAQGAEVLVEHIEKEDEEEEDNGHPAWKCTSFSGTRF